MKLFIVVLLACFFVAQLHAEVTVDEVGNKIIYSFELDGVDVTNTDIRGIRFIKAKIKGADGYEAIHFVEGQPEIPVISFYVNAERIEDVKVVFSNKNLPQVRKHVNDIVPAQKSAAKFFGHGSTYVVNTTIYSENKFYPEGLFKVRDSGPIKGIGQKLVTVYPLKYNPVLKATQFLSSFKVEVTNAPSSLEKLEGFDTFAFVIGKKFADSPSVAKYVKYKTAQGFLVKKIIIGQDAQTPEEIRAILKGIYSDPRFNLKYALLIGDAEDVPGKPAAHLKLSDGLTDHFYRAIDTDDYESDINGPDIGVGRVAVDTEAELATVVAKFIKYQNGDFKDQSWLDNIAFVATDDRGNYTTAEGSHNYVILNYTTPNGYTGVFPSDPMLGGDQLYAITHKVTNNVFHSTINQGRFIINYSGHGMETYWAGPDFYKADFKKMTHADALPFVISNACLTGNYGTDVSFAEMWLRHPSGAIMFWGSYDSSYWDEDDYLEKAMYKYIYNYGGSTFAGMTQHALKDVWRVYGGQNRSKYYWETYAIFGDPSILLRNKKVIIPKIDGARSQPSILDSVEYSVLTPDGVPVVGVRVAALLKDTSNVSYGITDMNGKAIIKIKDGLPGNKYEVRVYGKNLKVVPFELLLVSSDKPYILFQDMKILGRNGLDIFVNDDIAITFNLFNAGSVATSGGSYKIIKAIGPITYNNAAVTIPAVEADSAVADNTGINFAVLPEAQDGDQVYLEVEWMLNEEVKGVAKLYFNVKRAKVTVTSVDFGDPDRPLVGGQGPGGEVNLYINLKNNGGEDFKNARLNAVADACLTFPAGQINVSNVSAKGTYRLGPIPVKIGNCPNIENQVFLLEGMYKSKVSDLPESIIGAKFIVGNYGFQQHLKEPNLAIVDEETVIYKFSLDKVKILDRLSIRLKVEHTYVGDIKITLTHPSGKKIIIRDREGGSNSSFDMTYKIKGLEQLSTVGEWKLEINDVANGDVGFLKLINVEAKGYY